MTLLIALVVLAGIGVYLLTPDERLRLGALARDRANGLLCALLEDASGREPLRAALHARTRWPVVTWVLVVAQTIVFVRMILGPGAFSDAETLRAWGASVAPSTTNGEWWRLVTSPFVPAGPMHVLATMIGLIPVGLILERVVGHVAFGATFLAAGMVAALTSLSLSPIAVATGTSGAIFGIYGLLAATLLWALPLRRYGSIPLKTAKIVGASAGLFALHSALDTALPLQAELAGLVTGCAGGLVLARGVIERKPPARRVAFTMAATIALVAACAIPLRGLIDVRPELARVSAVERRTAAAYGEAVVRFRKGWSTSDTLVALIETTIVPDLEAARSRLRALGRVPQTHQPMIADAGDYLDLRIQSWQTRTEAFRTSSLRMLQEAEATERAALEIFGRMPAAGELALTPPAQ